MALSRPTALITGASSGLGAEYARQLAARQYNLVLIARREDRLRELADQLTAQYGTHSEIITADLTHDLDVNCVEQRIKELGDLALLVNNAGFAAPGFFVKADFERQMDMIQLHILTIVRLTRAALPGMVARRQGAIINVSSSGGLYPYPGSAVYAATKAFLNRFTESIAYEIQGAGVKMQALCPGFVRTEIFDLADFAHMDVSFVPKIMWMNADTVVRISLAALERNRVVVIPGWLNRFLLLGLMRVPGVAHLMRRQLLAAQR